MTVKNTGSISDAPGSAYSAAESTTGSVIEDGLFLKALSARQRVDRRASVQQHPNAKDVKVRLQVRYGSLALRSVSLTGIGTAELPERRELHSRAVFETVVSREA